MYEHKGPLTRRDTARGGFLLHSWGQTDSKSSRVENKIEQKYRRLYIVALADDITILTNPHENEKETGRGTPDNSKNDRDKSLLRNHEVHDQSQKGHPQIRVGRVRSFKYLRERK